MENKPLDAPEVPPKKEKPPRYVVRDAKFALEPRPALDMVVEKILAVGSVSVIVGKYGSKKTWFLVFLAVCVSLCKAFLGLNVIGVTVLIVDEESGEDRLSRRIAMAIRGALGDSSAQIRYVSLAQFNFLRNPGDVVILKTLIEQTGAKLVIIDALADIMAGGDENAVKDTQVVFMRLRKVAETTKAALVIIHHTNKAGDYRGSSAIPGAIDNLYLIESSNTSNLVNFSTIKKRDGEPVEFSAVATWTEDQFYLDPIEYKKTEHLSKCHQYTLDFFTERKQATFQDLIDFTGELYSRTSLKGAVQELVNKKRIQRVNEGGKGTPAIYGPVEVGNG